MQVSGYVRYGATILTVQYRWAPSLWHGTKAGGQTPVCDAMASYIHVHDVLLYSGCYAMPSVWWTGVDWTDQARAGRYQGWRPCASIDVLLANQPT
jgi:hypothetical protein